MLIVEFFVSFVLFLFFGNTSAKEGKKKERGRNVNRDETYCGEISKSKHTEQTSLSASSVADNYKLPVFSSALA